MAWIILLTLLIAFPLQGWAAAKTTLMQQDMGYCNVFDGQPTAALTGATIQARIDALAGAKCTIYLGGKPGSLPAQWTVSAALVIPSTITLLIPDGATVTGAGNLTIARLIASTERSWYIGSGTLIVTQYLYSGIGFRGPTPWRDIKAYGAVGDGVVDDTAAIQAAINAAAYGDIVYCSTGLYKITASLLINKPIGFGGSTRASCALTTAANIPLVHIYTTLFDIYGADISDIAFINTVGGASSVGILIDGPNSFRRSSITRNRFSGSLSGIKLAVTGTAVVDWTDIAGNLFDNSGSVQTNYGINSINGGTGNIIQGNHFITTIAGIYIKGPGIGDMVITGNHLEGGTNSIYLENVAPFTYASRFVVVGNKMDSVTQPIVLIRVSNSTIVGNRYVGGVISPVSADVNSLANIIDIDFGQGIAYQAGHVAIGATASTRRLTVLDPTSLESFQMRIGTDASTFNYDIGRITSDGLLYFYGNQAGANGYVFQGIDRTFLKLNNSGTVVIPNLQTTGSATGKKVVCVDTATGILYASSTGTDCTN